MPIGITKEQEMVLIVKGLISDLTPDQQKQTLLLAEHLRDHLKSEFEGAPCGRLAFALVGAQMSNE